MHRIISVNRVFLATVILSIIGASINGIIGMYTDNYFIILLMSQIILVAPSIAYFIINRIRVADAIRFRSVSTHNIFLVVLFAFLIQPLMNFINAISMIFVQNTTTEVVFDIVDKNGLWLSLFMIAFVPAVLEETVYRGVFYNEYRKVSPWKGILLSGFLFGIIHGNLNQFSYAFAMGIVFALVIEATDSILSTMVVHFVINGTSVILLYLYPKLLEYVEAVYGMEGLNTQDIISQLQNSSTSLRFAYVVQSYGLSALIFTPLAFLVFKSIAKKTGRWEIMKQIVSREYIQEDNYETSNIYEQEMSEWDFALTQSYDDSSEEQQTKKKSLLTGSLIAGIIICVALLVVNELYAVDSIQPLENGDTLVIYLQNLFMK